MTTYSNVKKKQYALIWGAYWRSILAIFLSLMLLAFSHSAFGILSLVNNNKYVPAFFWSLLVLLLFVISLFQAKGLCFLIWGNRLGLRAVSWQKLNFLIMLFFAGLALLSILVSTYLSATTWSDFKLFFQPFLLVVIPAVCSLVAVPRHC